MGKSNLDAPDCPPQLAATDFANGRRAYGPTEQLFESKNGRWVRIERNGELVHREDGEKTNHK